ncbi:MAG TPA: hypothetical protein VMS17_29830 [Gemmataceae bacterium]|nr:hypothetical protein [Gemmataceae bacterium]
MSLTITVKDKLARRLRAQAAARRLSVQQWALTILANASQSPEDADAWIELNNRRTALIRKRCEAGLSETEEQELARLQAAAAALLEPYDRRRLEHVRSLIHDADAAATP